MRGDPEGLTHGKETDRDGHDVNAVEQMRVPEGETRLAREGVDADEA